MSQLPATDLRKNVLTLAVRRRQLPWAGFMMRGLLPAEEYDPQFLGQELETTYFDTRSWDLRRARLEKNKYLTIRIRCYRALGEDDEKYALSMKSESGKWRTELSSPLAESLIADGAQTPEEFPNIPGDILARCHELTDDQPLVRIVCIKFRRYAVESSTDRLTLDTSIATSGRKRFPCAILEVKSLQKPYTVPDEISRAGLDPIRLSKFLWATSFGMR